MIASIFLHLVVALLAAAFVLYQIFRLLRAVASGAPFSRTAVRRIATIGWTVTGTELVLFGLTQLLHPSEYLEFELGCQPGDLLVYVPEPAVDSSGQRPT